MLYCSSHFQYPDGPLLLLLLLCEELFVRLPTVRTEACVAMDDCAAYCRKPDDSMVVSVPPRTPASFFSVAQPTSL